MINALPTMSPPVDDWRCFRNVASDAEAAAFSERCLYSLATLEIDCDPATHRFALTEREQPGAWRWAIVNDRGAILQSGREPTQDEAKTIAAVALHQAPSPESINEHGAIPPLHEFPGSRRQEQQVL